MRSQPIKFLLLAGLGLSLFAGNSVQAQSNGDVVVPTGRSSGGSPTVSTGTRTRTNDSVTTDGSVQTAERFVCRLHNGQYTVMYQPRSQPGKLFAWATPQSLSGPWDAQTRCTTIAQRLESYRPDGLSELQTAVENRQNIVCVTTEDNPSCRIVLTVPPGRDAFVVRNSVFENLVTADNGQETFGVNTFGNRGNDVQDLYNMGRSVLGGNKPQVSASKSPINLKPYLSQEDRGTGTGLRNGVSIRRNNTPTRQPGAKLRPGNFR